MSVMRYLVPSRVQASVQEEHCIHNKKSLKIVSGYEIQKTAKNQSAVRGMSNVEEGSTDREAVCQAGLRKVRLPGHGSG